MIRTNILKPFLTFSNICFGRSFFALTFILFLLLLQSCGYVNDSKNQEDSLYNPDSFKASCSYDASALSDIFVRNIESDIVCLKSAIYQFVNYVELDDSKKLTRDSLARFADKFYNISQQDSKEALSLVLTIGNFFWDDSKDSISITNIDRLANFLISLNRFGTHLTTTLPLLENNYLQKKESITKEAYLFIKSIDDSISLSTSKNQGIDLVLLFSELETIMTITPQTQRMLFTFKNLLVGGKKTFLTIKEVENTLPRLSLMISLAFDLFEIKKDLLPREIKSNKIALLNFHHKKIDELVSILHRPHSPNQKLLEKLTILETLESFNYFSTQNKEKWFYHLWEIKKILTNSSEDFISLADLDIIVYYAHLALELKSIDIASLPLSDVKNKNITIDRLNEFVARVLAIRHPKTPIPRTNLLPLIQHIKDLFNLTSNLETLVPLKKILVGGDNNYITNQEMLNIVKKSPAIFSFYIKVMDAINNDFYIHEQSSSSTHQFLDIILLFIKNHLHNPQNISINRSELLEIEKAFESFNAGKQSNFADTLWQLNELLSNGKSSEITTNSIETLIEHAHFSLDVKELSSAFIDITKTSSNELFKARGEFQNLIKNFNNKVKASKFFSIFQSIDIMRLQRLIQDVIPTTFFSNSFTQTNINFLKPIRMLFTGTKEDIVTKKELSRILDILPATFDIYCDFKIYQTSDKKTEETEKFVLKKTQEIQSLFYPHKLDTLIFTLEDIQLILDKLQINFIIFDHKQTIKIFKDIFFDAKSQSEDIYFNDILSLVKITSEQTKQLIFNRLVATTFSSKIFSKEKIQSFSEIELLLNSSHSTLNIFSKDELIRQQELFCDIITSEHFFINHKTGARYAHNYSRSLDGINFLSIADFLTKKAIKYFGEKSTLSLEKLLHLLNSITPLLEYADISNDEIDRLAKNIIYSADIFSSTGNGDGLLDKKELRSFFTFAYSINIFSKKMQHSIDMNCPVTKEGEDYVIAKDCLFQNYSLLITRDDLDIGLINLQQALQNQTLKNEQQYFDGIWNFSALSPDANYMFTKDLLTFFGVITNIETFFIRFDINQDDYIDDDELEGIHNLLKPMIISIGKLEKNQYKHSKSILKYLIVKKKIPSTADLVLFNLLATPKIHASKSDFSQILKLF